MGARRAERGEGKGQGAARQALPPGGRTVTISPLCPATGTVRAAFHEAHPRSRRQPPAHLAQSVSTRPFLARGGSVPRCDACQLRHDWCACDWRPALKAEAGFAS